jgi:hypothetical protein
MSGEIVRRRLRRSVPYEKPPNSWLDRELADYKSKEERLGKRFRSLIEQLSSSPGDTIPLVCQDWANAKAAYRSLDNDRVSEPEILGDRFQATRDRTAVTSGQILVLHDTTEFTCKRDDCEAIGKTFLGVAEVDLEARPRHCTACGILMHSSLSVTTGGLPLGLTAIKFWSRDKFKASTDLIHFTSLCQDEEPPKEGGLFLPLPHRAESELTPIAIGLQDCNGLSMRDNAGELLACYPTQMDTHEAPIALAPRGTPSITWLDSPPEGLNQSARVGKR